MELYSADPATLDFHDPASAAVINAWMARRTKNQIREIVSTESVSGARSILANAVYFKSKWQFPFDLLQTNDAPFHLGTGATKRTPFMRRSGLRNVYRCGYGFEAAVMPYASPSADSNLALVALLPEPGRTPGLVYET